MGYLLIEQSQPMAKELKAIFKKHHSSSIRPKGPLFLRNYLITFSCNEDAAEVLS